MSWSPDPIPGDRASVNAVETLIVPRAVDLGEMEVRRALPSTKRQMVGRSSSSTRWDRRSSWLILGQVRT